MKLLTLLVLFSYTHAFYVVNHQRSRRTTFFCPHAAAGVLEIDLDPEPEGGRELTPISTMPNCRMKEMEEIIASKSEDKVFKFWLTAQAEGVLLKEIRTQILKDASKKANFPGFRKVRKWSFAVCCTLCFC